MTIKDTIEKQKLKVYAKMSDGQRLLGFFFSEPSERLQDLLNDERHFLPLYALGDNGKYHLVMIAKSFVQQVEEVFDLPESDFENERRDGTDRRTTHELRSTTTPKFELD
jgi:hypothetical protein